MRRCQLINSPQLGQREHGGAMIEVCLSVGVIMLLVVVGIDIARYVYLQTSLTRGAQEGLDLALKLEEMKLSPTSLSDPTNRANFLRARDRILAHASRLPLVAGFVPEGPAERKRRLLQWRDPLATAVGSPPQQPISLNAVLIRPGDSSYQASDGYTASHPSLTTAPSGDYLEALAAHPLVVEVRAEIGFLTPFLPTKVVTSRAIGYFEQLQQSGTRGASLSRGPTLTTSSFSTTTSPATTACTQPVCDPALHLTLDARYCRCVCESTYSDPDPFDGTLVCRFSGGA